jgi:hypothetical protein
MVLALSGCAEEIRKDCQSQIEYHISQMAPGDTEPNLSDVRRWCPDASEQQRRRALRDALAS